MRRSEHGNGVVHLDRGDACALPPGNAGPTARCCDLTSSLLAVITLILSLVSPAPADARPPVKSLLEMRQDKVVVQQWDLSCGGAALATILNYQHGDPVSEREVALSLIHRKKYLENAALIRIQQGFSLLDLKRYVDRREYEGIGYGELTLGDPVENAPIMVPVNFHG